MKQYLEPSEFINSEHPQIQAQAKRLKSHLKTDVYIAKACFEYVRDTISHSWDYKIDQITCKASDVLQHKTGYCYAKSHLLAALLRANGIPAGLCYQRLLLSSESTAHCLHGLNAVYLKEFGWYRIDPRGNKEGVNAQFTPPLEQLAFSTNGRLEAELEGIWAEPYRSVVHALTTQRTCLGVYQNLPDIQLDT
ncbi:MAG: transglutaminase family protein [Pseudomonadales bacterium]|nr:transglutaminase family protein [Pseudomonadales bacterium]